MATKGLTYKVKSTYKGKYFKTGQKIVALESDASPYCVPLEKYKGPDARLDDYDLDDFWSIEEYHLEVCNA